MSFSIKFGPSFVVVFPLNVVLVVNFSHIYLLLQTLNHFATKLENTYNTIMLILNIVISACEIMNFDNMRLELCCMSVMLHVDMNMWHVTIINIPVLTGGKTYIVRQYNFPYETIFVQLRFSSMVPYLCPHARYYYS